MVPAELLRRIRNDLPMAATIAALGRDGPPAKFRDGRFCFLCPRCGELLAYVNPARTTSPTASPVTKTSTNIDPLRSLGHDFRSAITLHRTLARPLPGPPAPEQDNKLTNARGAPMRYIHMFRIGGGVLGASCLPSPEIHRNSAKPLPTNFTRIPTPPNSATNATRIWTGTITQATPAPEQRQQTDERTRCPMRYIHIVQIWGGVLEPRVCLLQNSPESCKPLTNSPESLHPEFGNKCDQNLDRDTHSASSR